LNDLGLACLLWFNPAAFTVPAAFTYGNSGPQYPLRSWSFQLGCAGDAHVPDKRAAEAAVPRGEFFNFTITALFNLPVTNIQASNAGHITSAGAPRDIKLALKLLF
jgi:hypothetical protein